jgi:hypothetical protein
MKNMFSRISLFIAGCALATSCSKTPYASFGGGPKKLSAEPQARNIYAAEGQEYQRSAAARPAAAAVTACDLQETLSPEIIRAAISQIDKNPAVASSRKLTFGQKVSLARQAVRLRKDIEKAQVAAAPEKATEGGKSQLIALILVILVGGLGIHRFYLGYTLEGVIQLLTAGGCGIWALIDLIRIVMGTLKPKDGEYEKTL